MNGSNKQRQPVYECPENEVKAGANWFRRDSAEWLSSKMRKADSKYINY